MNVLATALVSGAIAAGVSGLATLWGIHRNIRYQAITEARQVWRDTLRRLVPEFTTAETSDKREAIGDAIRLHLNPHNDKAAHDALAAMKKDPSAENREKLIKAFAELLKYDWERAKVEAKSLCAGDKKITIKTDKRIKKMSDIATKDC